MAISPLLWFTTFTRELKALGFRQSLWEPCLLYKLSEVTTVLVLVYVDDVLIARNNLPEINSTIHSLKTKFLVKELGFPETYDGFEVEKSEKEGILTLHQRTYARTFLNMFLPENQRGSRSTPINTFGNFPKSETSEEPLTQSIPYRSITGTLYYYANGTCPDILFEVNYLSRVQSKSRNIHWTLLQQVLRYIDSTKNLELMFCSSEPDICEYVDADFASDYTTSDSDHQNMDKHLQLTTEFLLETDLQAEVHGKHNQHQAV